MIVGNKSYLMEGWTNRWGGEIIIGKYTSIGPKCQFICGEIYHGFAHKKGISNYVWKHHISGPINIGNDVWIGQDVTIVGGVTIGHGAIVGAGAVVAKDVPPYAVVIGNPQQIVRYRFTPEQIEKILAKAWWDWPDDVVDLELPDATIENFL